MTRFVYLSLEGNQLTGTIPCISNITGFSGGRRPVAFNLANNRLSGQLPYALGQYYESLEVPIVQFVGFGCVLTRTESCRCST